jgi:hypothetical protein
LAARSYRQEEWMNVCNTRGTMITNKFGDGMKYIQTGRVQNYLLLAITGAAIFVFVFFLIR